MLENNFMAKPVLPNIGDGRNYFFCWYLLHVITFVSYPTTTNIATLAFCVTSCPVVLKSITSAVYM